MHDDIDYDCDIEICLNPFLLITVSDAFIRRMADVSKEQLTEAFEAGAAEAPPRDLPPLSREDLYANMAMEPLTSGARYTLDAYARCTSGPVAKLVNIGPDNDTAYLSSLPRDIIFAHPPCRPEYEKVRDRPDFTPEAGPVVSAALALPDIVGSPELRGYKQLVDELNRRTAPGLPASVFERCNSGSFSESASATAAAVAFRRRLSVGIMPEVSEFHARTWGDHGELFELPLGWTFQDNMIQNKPADDLIIIVTYDADNLPNPWEWQLHEPAPDADDTAPWDQVPSTNDKPRAGWAPTLIAAMTRSATAAQLHLDDRRAAGGA